MLIRALTYENANPALPATAPRTISLTVSDRDGETSTASEIMVAVRVPATGVLSGNETVNNISLDVVLGDVDGDGVDITQRTGSQADFDIDPVGMIRKLTAANDNQMADYRQSRPALNTTTRNLYFLC